MKNLFLIAVIMSTAACAPIMEANRPDPVDMSQFATGESRINVVSQLGSPTSTLPDKGNSCDIYKLYTKGPGKLLKGAIAAGEIVADIVTVFLAELIFTPTEAATKDDRHAVVFCYNKDNNLVSLTQSDSNSGK